MAAEMDEGEGGPQLWALYLHQAEREPSLQATRSFWLGKFLQALPESVLFSCREHIGRTGQQKKPPIDPQHQIQWPTAVQEQETEEVELNVKRISVAAAENVRDSKDVFQLAGGSREPLWVHVQRADDCLRWPGRQTCTSLSPTVHRLVVESVVAATADPLPGPLRPDATLDWTTVETFLGNDVVCERSDYAKGAVKCAVLAAHVSDAVRSSPHLLTLWSGLFTWTGKQQLFEECVQLWLSSDSDCDVCDSGTQLAHHHDSSRPVFAHHLCLLLCSAGLERALGDAYLSVSGASQCPSLLRDLLNAPQLEDTFGKTAMCCLRCLVGPPSGLNLRNIFWHGFPSPGEISSNYVCLLLAMAASLGAGLASVEVVHRPPVSLQREEFIMTGTFPELYDSDIGCIERLFAASFFVPASMLPLWMAGLTAFKHQRYHHSLVLLLPALEHGLRRVFACVNHCPHRVLTAESTALYTTFDEILSPTLQDLSPNRLHHEIGPAKLECLLDLLVQPEGPRLRDRISHGEVDFYSLSKPLANHVVSLCALFCVRYSLDDPTLTSEPPIAKCLAVERSYEPLFHPASLLKRELLEGLETWSTIPLPPTPPDRSSEPTPEDRSHLTELIVAVQRLADSALVPTAARSYGSLPRALQQVNDLCHGSGISETWEFSTALKRLVEIVWEERREGERERVSSSSRSLCSRAGLELIGLLRRTTENTANTLCQVRDMAVLRHKQHQQKQLRSRQRKNYEHLLSSLPLYRGAVCLIAVMIAVTVLQFHQMTCTDTSARKAIEFYRKVLQVSENLSSQTSASRNRWEEADRLALSLAQLSLYDILPALDTALSTSPRD